MEKQEERKYEQKLA
jgi:hypothetical protein